MRERNRKLAAILGIVAFVGAMVALFFAAGKPMGALLADPAAFRQWVKARGFGGKLAFMGMMAAQIVVAVIPGEPLEIGAGYAFGVWEGTLLCMLGAGIGGALVFLFVRKLGMRAVEVFFSREKIDSMGFMRDTGKLNLWMWILFLIPGTPKDILSYIAGLTRIRFSTWMMITTFARIPSIITSTISGNALGEESYAVAIGVFGGTLLIAGAGLIFYNRFCAKQNGKPQA